MFFMGRQRMRLRGRFTVRPLVVAVVMSLRAAAVWGNDAAESLGIQLRHATVERGVRVACCTLRRRSDMRLLSRGECRPKTKSGDVAQKECSGRRICQERVTGTAAITIIPARIVGQG